MLIIYLIITPTTRVLVQKTSNKSRSKKKAIMIPKSLKSTSSGGACTKRHQIYNAFDLAELWHMHATTESRDRNQRVFLWNFLSQIWVKPCNLRAVQAFYHLRSPLTSQSHLPLSPLRLVVRVPPAMSSALFLVPASMPFWPIFLIGFLLAKGSRISSPDNSWNFCD